MAGPPIVHKYVQRTSVIELGFRRDFQIKRSRLRRRYGTALTWLLHTSLILFKLLFLVIVQNGFDLGVGIAVNAPHLRFLLVGSEGGVLTQQQHLSLLIHQNG